MERELIDRLVRDVTPVRPLAPPAVRVARWALVSTVCVGAGVALAHVRHDIGASMWTTSFLVQAGLLLTASLFGATAALVVGVPGAQPTWATRWVPLGAIAAWAAWLVESIATQPDHLRVWWPGPAVHCAATVTLLALLPGLLLWSLVRRAAPLRPAWAGLLATLTAAAAGALGTQLICPRNDAAHLLLWHAAPVMAMAIAGIQVGRRFLHWPPRPASTPPQSRM